MKFEEAFCEYYHKLFDKVKSDLKGTRKVINNILNKTKKKNPCDKLRNENVLIEDKQHIANSFYDYFSTIGIN